MHLTLRLTGPRLLQTIGDFGWLDTPAPHLTKVIWIVAVAALVVLGLAISARCRRALPLLALAIVAMPVLFEAPKLNASGTYWQGRYWLPLIVGVPLLASTALGRIPALHSRRSPAAVIAVLTAGLILGVAQAGRLPYRVTPLRDRRRSPSASVAALVATRGICVCHCYFRGRRSAADRAGGVGRPGIPGRARTGQAQYACRRVVFRMSTGTMPPPGPPAPDGAVPTPRRHWRDWYMVAVLTGFVAACLGPSLVGLRTLLAVNELTNFYPWNAARGTQVLGHSVCTGDTIDAGMPAMAYVRDQLFSGHLANWQNLVAGGGPLSGVPNLGLLDPLSLPYFILPLWLAPAFVVLLEFVVAIGGTFLFLRRLHLSRAASILAGIIFASSGFMVVWTNWPQTRVAALIPALFWAVERLVQRMRPVDAVLIALVVASMVFGGFPQVTGFAVYLAAGYLLVRVLTINRDRLRRSWRPIALAASGLLGGLLLAMVQLLPFLSFYQNADLSYRSGDGRVGLPFTGLITLIAPNAYGMCVGGHAVHGPSNPVEMIAYIGSAAAVLAVAGAAFGFSRSRTQPARRPRLLRRRGRLHRPAGVGQSPAARTSSPTSRCSPTPSWVAFVRSWVLLRRCWRPLASTG